MADWKKENLDLNETKATISQALKLCQSKTRTHAPVDQVRGVECGLQSLSLSASNKIICPRVVWWSMVWSQNQAKPNMCDVWNKVSMSWRDSDFRLHVGRHEAWQDARCPWQITWYVHHPPPLNPPHLGPKNTVLWQVDFIRKYSCSNILLHTSFLCNNAALFIRRFQQTSRTFLWQI